MKYKVMYVCYLTRSKKQKQIAFISKSTHSVRIADDIVGDIEWHSPLIEVEFFETKESALKNASMYCSPDNIHEITG